MIVINNYFDDNKVTISIDGKIDTNACSVLHDAINGVSSSFNLVLDFTKVRYICSSGLRELLMAIKRFGNNFSVINVNDEVEEIFKVTGFDTIIPYSKEDPKDHDYNYLNRSFKGLLEAKASENKDFIIIKNETESITFGMLDAAATIMANDLAKMGVKENSHVGIFSVNSISWIVAFFAVEKLGAMALLLNFSYTKEELKTVAEVSDLEYICYGFTKNFKTEDEFSYLNLKRCFDINKCYESINNRLDEYELTKNQYSKHYDADRPSVMIFTSGSTGVPKGVILSALNIIKTKAVIRNLYDDDRMLLFLPLFHVFGLAACLIPCMCKNLLIYLPNDISPSNLVESIYKEKLTVFNTVPTMMLAMVTNPNFTKEKVSTLRHCNLSGAATPEAQFAYFQKVMPDCLFFSSYGMSENVMCTSTLQGDTPYHITHTVGTPQPGAEIKIDKPNSEGIGEVLVRSDSLMTGYYKLPIDKQGIDEDGFMHTGDLGKIEDDGYLVLCGRIKELIIRGGENIMPQEVANAISLAEGVKDVKVLGVPSEYYGEEVAAAIVFKDGYHLDIESLKSFLLTKIAKYKIPSFIVEYDKFPLLGSGKIDAVALKKDLENKFKNR